MSQQALEAAPRPKYRPVSEIAPNSLSVVLVLDSPIIDTTAYGEIFQAINMHNNHNVIGERFPAPVPQLNTLATGILVRQYALHNDHDRLVVVSGTAPYGVRPDPESRKHSVPWRGSKEQPFAFAEMPNGVPVFYVDAGYVASGLKDHAMRFWQVKADPEGSSPFRMRDVFAEKIMRYINGDGPVLDEIIDPETIPAFPDDRLGLVDGQGNLHATTRVEGWPDYLADQENVSVTVGGVVRLAKNRVTKEGGHRKEGDIVVQIGSLGGRNNPYIEIAVVGHSPETAQEVFDVPARYGEHIIVEFTEQSDALIEMDRTGELPLNVFHPVPAIPGSLSGGHLQRVDERDLEEERHP